MVLVLGSVVFLNYSGSSRDDPVSAPREAGGLAQAGSQAAQQAEPAAPPPARGPSKEELSGQPETSPEAAAYRALAMELPGVEPGSVKGVYRSALDPLWASVLFEVPGEEEPFFVFAREEDGGEWRAHKSIRADEPEYSENEEAMLEGVPEDLVASVYPENLAEDPEGLLVEPERPGALPRLGPVEFAPPEPVIDGAPGDERGRVDNALGGIRGAVEGYEDQHGGIAGAYVLDVKGGFGYGVRPDEPFFAASVIKVPVMVAVYRAMDEGKFALEDSFPTEAGDWASGAGWLQWQEPGVEHTVQDYLYMMMIHSDNVATNALIRKVGGPEYVNEVARDLGATNTVLYQKVTSERAAVPLLDNRTTPRDMAAMLAKISTGQAASRVSCDDMMYVMYQSNLDRWLEAGLPADMEAANKTGWLYKVYDDAGIVADAERPYVVAIFSKHGPYDPEVGKLLIEDISRAAWDAQSRE